MWKYYKPYLGRYALATDETGLLYLAYDQGTVHVLNPEGDLIGKYQAELPDTPVIEDVAAGNGTLYAAVRGGNPASVDLSALDVNGTCLWKTAINSTGPIELIPAGNMVCAATEIARNGRTVPAIFVLDSHQGRVEYTYYTAGQDNWDKVCVAGSTIYALSGEGRLYALRLPETAQR
jgi:outer membrane protein assembly factor BamB